MGADLISMKIGVKPEDLKNIIYLNFKKEDGDRCPCPFDSIKGPKINAISTSKGYNRKSFNWYCDLNIKLRVRGYKKWDYNWFGKNNKDNKVQNPRINSLSKHNCICVYWRLKN